MGRAVVHFEVIGKDDEKLRSFYGELFDWRFNADNPMRYGIVDREQNTNDAGVGIGGGVGWVGPEGGEVWSTFYVEVDDVEQALSRAESLGGTRVMGPVDVPGGPTMGQFRDPEGSLIGVVEAEGK
jgi:predicted enzyme related to lactoylglutathione lyase